MAPGLILEVLYKDYGTPLSISLFVQIYGKMFRFNIVFHKTEQSPFKTRNTGSYHNVTWRFVPEFYNSIMQQISITNA